MLYCLSVGMSNGNVLLVCTHCAYVCPCIVKLFEEVYVCIHNIVRADWAVSIEAEYLLEKKGCIVFVRTYVHMDKCVCVA